MRRTSVIQSHGDWNIYDNQQFRIQRVKVSGFLPYDGMKTMLSGDIKI